MFTSTAFASDTLTGLVGVVENASAQIMTGSLGGLVGSLSTGINSLPQAAAGLVDAFGGGGIDAVFSFLATLIEGWVTVVS
jgi:hypothetical protein